jgi:hypothetical protein
LAPLSNFWAFRIAIRLLRTGMITLSDILGSSHL